MQKNRFCETLFLTVAYRAGAPLAGGGASDDRQQGGSTRPSRALRGKRPISLYIDKGTLSGEPQTEKYATDVSIRSLTCVLNMSNCMFRYAYSI